jgi:hypothetical protein
MHIAAPRFNAMELLPTLERQLYLITRDETILRADPEGKLREALMRYNKLRLKSAKGMTRARCFGAVPGEARERFLPSCTRHRRYYN